MKDNLQNIQTLYAAFKTGNVPAVLDALDSGITWIEAEGFPYGGNYTGPKAVLENVFGPMSSDWDYFSVMPRSFVADGDTVVALGDYSGTYKATGNSFEAPFAHVWQLHNGKVVRFQQYTDTAVVQEALRLR